MRLRYSTGSGSGENSLNWQIAPSNKTFNHLLYVAHVYRRQVLIMDLLIGHSSGPDKKSAASIQDVSAAKLSVVLLLLFGKCDQSLLQCIQRLFHHLKASGKALPIGKV